MRRLNPSLVTGGVLVALVVLTALVSLVWTPHDPTFVDAAIRLRGPEPAHPLGTDKFGRDVLSQVMAGAQITLLAAVGSVAGALVVGTPLGVLAGVRHGWLAELIMRCNDFLLAFPALLFAIMLGAVYGTSTLTAMIAISVATVPVFARLTRAATLVVMSREYVLAARVGGRGNWWIAVRHVLPNISSVVILQSSVSFAVAILAEAALSFLGLGTKPPTPSWGRMLQESQEMLFTAPLLALWPGLAIAVSVLGFNLLGDGVRDLLDPALREVR